MGLALKQLEQTWNLRPAFSATTSDSPALADYMAQLEKELSALEVPAEFTGAEQLAAVYDHLNKEAARLHELSSFLNCLVAQNVKDEKALAHREKTKAIRSLLQQKWTQFDEALTQIDDKNWETWLEMNVLKPFCFSLAERRLRAKEKLSVREESLISDLAIDGYEGWSSLYDTVVGQMEVDFEVDGKKRRLSIGQLANYLSHPIRHVRREAHLRYTKAWEENERFCAEALNHLAGFRLNVYKHRGWNDVLQEPLAINRMKKETLEAMWQAVSEHKNAYVRYLQRKADALGVERLSWFDVGAPLAQEEEKVPYEKAAEMIVEQFSRFSPKMAEFAKKAFSERWIEAEDRPGKRPGGFCTSFPVSGESRIFMTYSGTKGNVATLAHEIGHAFHQYVMKDLPYPSQRYAMNVAETASTFAEMIVADACVKNAATPEEKRVLLEDKVQRGTAFFMNIHARFLFETRFYEERKSGPVSVERLKELMKQAQQEAYCEALADYQPLFWASKLHFYITGTPFYNFPYTFGYLFSTGIYARAVQEGARFEDRYIALLRDTGRMTVEDLARKHLDVDLTKPDFWREAARFASADVDAFLEL